MISYTWKINSVDEQAKCMMVEYSAVGYDTITVGTVLPDTNNPIDSIVSRYAPIHIWEESKKQYVIPKVGERGEYVPPAPVVEPVVTSIDTTTSTQTGFPTRYAGIIPVQIL